MCGFVLCELIELVRSPGELDPISPDAVRGQTFLFYAEPSPTGLAALRPDALSRLLARRLQNLVKSNHLPTLTVEMVREYLLGLEEDPERFIVGDEFVATEEYVPKLLDVLDQRHYRGGYDHLLRRADRNSVVSQGRPILPRPGRGRGGRPLRTEMGPSFTLARLGNAFSPGRCRLATVADRNGLGLGT
jgi:hypothetical protein